MTRSYFHRFLHFTLRSLVAPIWQGKTKRVVRTLQKPCLVGQVGTGEEFRLPATRREHPYFSINIGAVKSSAAGRMQWIWV